MTTKNGRAIPRQRRGAEKGNRTTATKTNWCEYLAERIRPQAIPYPVYSYCNPDREYNGETLVEFNENEYDVRTTITGAEYREHKLVVSCRTPTYEESDALTRAVMGLIEEILDPIDGIEYCWDEEGVEADVRGIVEGESFHGYAEFTINEKVDIL